MLLFEGVDDDDGVVVVVVVVGMSVLVNMQEIAAVVAVGEEDKMVVVLDVVDVCKFCIGWVDESSIEDGGCVDIWLILFVKDIDES